MLENEQSFDPSFDTVEARIKHLSKMSGFERNPSNTPDCTLERGGERFVSRLVTNHKDPILKKVQQLFENTFKKEEVCSLSDMKDSIKGMKDDKSGETVYYRVVVLNDEKGELICTSTGMTMRLRDQNNQPTNEAIYFACYGAGKKGVGMKMMSLANEIFVSSLISAKADAKAIGVNLIGCIAEGSTAGEAEGTLGGEAPGEAFANRLGFKRVMIGNKEAEYYQPAMDFNPDTGKPAKGAGAVLEHPEVMPFGPNLSKEQLIQAGRAAFIWNYFWDESDFNNTVAYQEHVKYVAGYFKIFEDSINQPGELALVTKQERKNTVQNT
ncbi:MAG: hypothetical protein Q7R97_01275 [Candidatus Daviesbacteria bacterium]|nr:hypothetical protein [Candidatus Daviesbacteria bacterium]